MSNVREILTQWGGSSGGVHYSVMFFDSLGAIATQRTALQTFWTSVKAQVSPHWGYTILTTGRDLDETDGSLVAAWAEASAKTGVGTGGTEQVADATQALIRWNTNVILNGRFLKGRTYVPGLQNAALTNGNLGVAPKAALQAAANSLIAAGGLMVWSRPVKDPVTHSVIRPGSGHFAVSATIWDELAILRKRRA